MTPAGTADNGLPGDRPLRIGHVLPAATKAGGGERVAMDLANHAAETGHAVWLIVGWSVAAGIQESAFDPRIRIDFVSNHRSVVIRHLSAVVWIVKHRARLAELDVLHCHLTYGSLFATVTGVILRMLGSRRPTVVETYHAVGMRISKCKQWSHARLAATRDGLALMAEDDYWRAFREKRSRLFSAVVPNGTSLFSREDVEARSIRAFRQALGIPDKVRFVVGAVGMLRPERQPLLYIPIFRALADEFGDEVAFLLAGSGSELEKLRACISEHDLDEQVKLPGLVTSPEIAMSALDLYITVNVGGATGIAAMQAASLGIPLIAIQFQHGYQARPDDWIWSSSSLVEVSRRAIQILRSGDERRALAARQLEYVRRHHSVEGMSAAYERFYRVAIQRRALAMSSTTLSRGE